MKKYNYLFTGASTRGFCYVGVLKALEEREIYPDICAGSSIGAIILTFYILGYTVDEIEKEIDKLNMIKLFSDFNLNFVGDFALVNGNKYYNWLKEKIETKFYGEKYQKVKGKPVCFKDIEQELIIAAVNVETSDYEIFSNETTPDMELALALRITSSMPGLLKSVIYKGKTFIDGDILRAKPIWKAADKLIEEPKKLLEFRITGGKKNKVSRNPVKYVNAIVNTAAYNIDNEAANTYKNYINIVQIDINNLLFTDFILPKERKKQIYKTGYEVTIEYLKNII
ncbi:patatin-like phospholipase family protein [bacterium]|nr:patatin-like phospholipase family protein [bacterium]